MFSYIFSWRWSKVGAPSRIILPIKYIGKRREKSSKRLQDVPIIKLAEKTNGKHLEF